MMKTFLLSIWLPALGWVGQDVKTIPITPTPTTTVSSAARISLKVDPDRFVAINGMVGPDLMKKAEDIKVLADKGPDPIYLSINGPGGYVYVQGVIIQSMELAQSRGIKVVCFTTVMAMSADFNMLSHCSERYALRGAKLLFHPIKSGTNGQPMRAVDFLKIAQELQTFDNELLAYLRQTMMEDGLLLSTAYYAEKVWDAPDLATYSKPGWITIIDDIEGVSDIFNFAQANGLKGIGEFGQEIINVK